MSIAMRDEIRARLGELVREFPPIRIEGQEQMAAVQARVDELLGRERDEAEELYLDLLGNRIEAWETVHEPMPDLYGVGLIRFLLSERGLPQRALVDAGVFPTESVASEVLSGKRGLRLEHVVRAAEYFHVPPESFLPTRAMEPA